MITELPMARQSADLPFKIEGGAIKDSSQTGHADLRNANHEYFRAMRIPLLQGRNFTGAEVRENARVVIISDVFAQRFFASEDPVGKRLYVEVISKEPYEIIGIVGDVRHRGLDIELRQTMYFPSLRIGYTNLVIRTTTDPASLTAAVRKEVAAIDPNQPVVNVKTMEQWVSESVAQPRFRTLLLGIFSAVALTLAAVGIYGVMAYSVTQRTHEIGIRMALGAGRWDVLRLVIGQGMLLVLIGIVVGLGGALVLTRMMSTLLFGVSATDPSTFILIMLLLLITALLACYIPARRATKVDPLIALRYE
jgi:predicted permease